MNDTLTASQNPSQWLEGVKFALTNLLLPIVVAVATYIIVDRWGEWRRRRNYSRLGVAVMESLQEEITTGIRLMSAALAATEDQNINGPPLALPSTKSWSGMSTISDEVLLRIIEASANQSFAGWHPRTCRIHCKNFFENMCSNYEETVRQSVNLARQGQDWRLPLRILLAQDGRDYIGAARGVYQLLEEAKGLLETNSRALRPK